MGRGESPGKGSQKMAGYFETIEGRSGGIMGSADGLFYGSRALFVQKIFSSSFCLFSNIHLIFAQSR